jgi:hypothetical protein
MTAAEREQFVKTFIDEYCLAVMATKGREYSRNEDDVNSNFKRVAKAAGLDPIKVAYIYAAKHWDSISNYVKTRETPSGEPIEGRLGDMLNYILILGSLIKEDQQLDENQY